jgi:hypothetical protein
MATPAEAALLTNVLAPSGRFEGRASVTTVSMTIDRPAAPPLPRPCCPVGPSGRMRGKCSWRWLRQPEQHPPGGPARNPLGFEDGTHGVRDCLSPFGHTWIAGAEAKNAGDVAVQYGISREDQDRWGLPEPDEIPGGHEGRQVPGG